MCRAVKLQFVFVAQTCIQFLLLPKQQKCWMKSTQLFLASRVDVPSFSQHSAFGSLMRERRLERRRNLGLPSFPFFLCHYFWTQWLLANSEVTGMRKALVGLLSQWLNTISTRSTVLLHSNQVLVHRARSLSAVSAPPQQMEFTRLVPGWSRTELPGIMGNVGVLCSWNNQECYMQMEQQERVDTHPLSLSSAHTHAPLSHQCNYEIQV